MAGYLQLPPFPRFRPARAAARDCCAVGAVLLAGCGYEAPLRDDVPELLNAISGSVVADGMSEPATSIIVVFAADNVGPPDGTGTPVSLSAVPPDRFSGTLANGFAGPYTVTQLADGDYVLDALMDLDGDFSPSLTAMGLAGATCGDFGGSYLGDYATRERGVVTVAGGQLIHDVPVIVDTEFVTERPAFAFAKGSPHLSRARGVDPFDVQQYHLLATGVHAIYDPGQFPNEAEYPDGYPLHLDGPCAPDPAEPAYCAAPTECETAFAVTFVDERDNTTGEAVPDGKVDFHPDYDSSEGLYDVWPRVFLQYLGVPTLDDQGNPARDEEGKLLVTPPDLPAGEFFAGENFPFAYDNQFGLGPIAKARTEGLLNVAIPMADLTVVWAPAVAHFYPEWNELCDGEPPADLGQPCRQTLDLRVEGAAVDDVPAGVWSVTVINRAGQIWTLPNELAFPAQELVGGTTAALQGEVLFTE